MPVRRRKNLRKEGISELEYAFLRDQPLPEGQCPFQRISLIYDDGEDPNSPLARLWGEHRDEVLEEWIEHSPGTRPRCWWLFDSPEPQDEVPENQTNLLEQLDLLTAAEKRRARRKS